MSVEIETSSISFGDKFRFFQQVATSPAPSARCIPKTSVPHQTRPSVLPRPQPSTPPAATSSPETSSRALPPPVALSRPAPQPHVTSSSISSSSSSSSSLASSSSPVRGSKAGIASRAAMFEQKAEACKPPVQPSRPAAQSRPWTRPQQQQHEPTTPQLPVAAQSRPKWTRPQPAAVVAQPSCSASTSSPRPSDAVGQRSSIAGRAALFLQKAEDSKATVVSSARQVKRLSNEKCEHLHHIPMAAQPGRSRHAMFFPMSADSWLVLDTIARDIVGRGRLAGARKVMVRQEAEELTCPLCFDTITDDQERAELDCRHVMHLECLRGQFDFQLRPDGDFPVCCAQCNLPTIMADWRRFYTEDQVVELGRVARTKMLEKSNGELRGCPTDGCLMIYKVADHPDGIRECQLCRKKHCLNCGIEYHEDLTCAAYQAWRSRNEANAAADAAWLQSQLSSGAMKSCPACRACMEKISGCNYVVCGSCRTPLCWHTGMTRATCGGGHNCH